MLKVFLLDNFDSFTYNLAALLKGDNRIELSISTPDKLKINNLSQFDRIVFSPGPGLPSEFPVMHDILDAYKDSKSILGVCLGHQMIGTYFGAKLVNLDQVSHGWSKKLNILKKDCKLFHDIPDMTEVGVYHSWYLSKDEFPDCLGITAESNDGIIMSIEHKTYNIQSVQFHPESFMTTYGKVMIQNWLVR